MNHYENLIAQFESEIRAGRPQIVIRYMTRLNAARVPRKYRRPFANICRRTGLFSIGMRLLSSIVYAKRASLDQQPSAAEIAEYAVLLTRVGALNEAAKLLQTVDLQSTPEALLYRAFICFTRWDFEAAIPLLQDYVQSPLTPYAQLVGRVNLAYGFVGANLIDQAQAQIQENIEVATRERHERLRSNSYEMLARMYVQQGSLDEASAALNTAVQNIGPESRSELLQANKWRAIIEGMRLGSTEPLWKFKAGLAPRDAEIVRELDQFALRIQFDQERFNYLLFGTNSHAFRASLCRGLKRFPQQSVFRLGPSSGPCLNLRTGEIDGRPVLDAGRKCHQLVNVLLRDFYRPLQLGEIFSEMFPGEHFLTTSANRLHQLLFRTREWIREEKLPIEIVNVEDCYSVRTTGPFSFLIPLLHAPVEGYHQTWDKLLQLYPGVEIFDPKEARDRLKISRTTFFRFARWATESGKLIKIGSYNTARYRIVGQAASIEEKPAA